MLTYNVAGLPVGISQSSPDVNSPLIGELINGYDIVVLQEDFGFFSADIAGPARHRFRSDVHPGPKELNPIDRDGVLAGDGLRRYSNFNFHDYDRQPWLECFGGADTSDGGAGDCLALKGFSVAATVLDTGIEVDIYNLHVEAGSTEADLAAAEAGLAQLAAVIVSRSPDRPLIIGGDWNLHSGRPAEATLLANFAATVELTTVCEVLDCGANANRIDQVMFRSGPDLVLTPVLHQFEDSVFVDIAGDPLSDHDPLVVHFNWEASAAGG